MLSSPCLSPRDTIQDPLQMPQMADSAESACISLIPRRKLRSFIFPFKGRFLQILIGLLQLPTPLRLHFGTVIK